MDKINCPTCKKELIRLEPYIPGVYEFWCDNCNIDAVIFDNVEISKNARKELVSRELKINDEKEND